jgi:hypothetical protein
MRFPSELIVRPARTGMGDGGTGASNGIGSQNRICLPKSVTVVVVIRDEPGLMPQSFW